MKYYQMPWSQVHSLVQGILVELYESGYRPDYIVGLPRGGLIPATMLSHLTGIPMISFDQFVEEWSQSTEVVAQKYLLVDDINDSGKTLAEIYEDLDIVEEEEGDEESGEVDILRVAVLVNNFSSDFVPEYVGGEWNKAVDPMWIIFPWETTKSTPR